MIQLAVIIALALLLLFLVRCNLLEIDLSFLWFASLVVLGFASLSNGFVEWVASVLNILYAPIAIILLTVFILLGLVTTLAVSLSRLKAQQLAIVRQLARAELDPQERAPD